MILMYVIDFHSSARRDVGSIGCQNGHNFYLCRELGLQGCVTVCKCHQTVNLQSVCVCVCVQMVTIQR